MTDVALFIGGTWEPGARAAYATVCDPATEAVCGRVAVADFEDVKRAIEAAHAAFPAWRDATQRDRAGVLRRAAAAVAEGIAAAALVLTTEQGKPLAESRAELQRAVDTFLWHADEAERI